MISFNLSSAVYGAQQRRTDYLEGTKVVYLAVRLTATTPGAVPCPVCWDGTLHQVASPEDPVCLGGGFVIPGPTGVSDPATQRGYLTPVLFEGVVAEASGTTQIGDMGYVEQSGAVLVWPDQAVEPKASDICIVSDPLTAPLSVRYLVDTIDVPGAFGGQTLLHRAQLTELRRESAQYQILAPQSDTTPDVPGAWS